MCEAKAPSPELSASGEPSKAPLAVRLLVCVGPRCDAEGLGRALLTELQDALRERFPAELAARRVLCSTRDCLRLCTREPVVRMEPSGDAFSNPKVIDLLGAVEEALDLSRKPTV